jgi:replication-associated recombination protein RarA
MSNQPLSELLRPQQLSDLTLPQRVIDRLQKMIDSGNIMNMIFYGPPGLGKTSAARVIGMTANVTFKEVNAASILQTGDLRRDMQGFATSFPLPGHDSRLCLFDEADYISKQVQASLQIPVHRGQSFRRIADSVPVIADSFR